MIAIAISLSIAFGGTGNAYAQSQTLSGKYILPGTGFEMTIPIGWTGTQVDRSRAVFTPADSSDVSITVLTAERLDTKEIVTSEIDVTTGRSALGGPECKSREGEILFLQTNKAFHTIHECSSPESYRITNTYVIFTLARSIAVSLSATSADAYERYLATFTDAVQTSKIDSQLNFRSALEIIFGTTGISTQSLNLEAANRQVGLVVATSSRISTVNFDEESKRLVVTLNELRRPEGNLLVPVNDVLRGPYQVYVNGELHNDFLVITDSDTGEQLVNVWYAQGERKIEIVGTEVVPEFSVALVVLGAMLSTAILNQRGAILRRPRH
jgi:hypothetical protein